MKTRRFRIKESIKYGFWWFWDNFKIIAIVSGIAFIGMLYLLIKSII
jgi:hypothetical protein